jgi:hypothetical protein
MNAREVIAQLQDDLEVARSERDEARAACAVHEQNEKELREKVEKLEAELAKLNADTASAKEPSDV